MKIEGNLNAEGIKIGFIASRFNSFITDKLLEGAKDSFIRHGGSKEDSTTVWVPGAYEIPLIAKKMAETDKFDAIVCLGAVIRGQTPHFDYVASEVSKGVAQIGLETNTPIIFSVLTTDTLEQAIERAGSKAGNKGFDGVCSAIEMSQLLSKLKEL